MTHRCLKRTSSPKDLISLAVLDSVMSWSGFQISYITRREGETTSSVDRFIKPLHRRLAQRIERAEFEAFSPGGAIPEIFSAPIKDCEENGPVGAYLRGRDILATAHECGLPSTAEISLSYRGGDMYTPLCLAMCDAHDYRSDVGKSLLRFNHTPIEGDRWPKDLSRAYGPVTPDLWIPSAILF